MKYLLLFLFFLIFFKINAQEDAAAFAAATAKHRQHYREEFITEARSPLSAKDTAFLDFFPADIHWKLAAKLVHTPDAEPFDMPTYSGRTAQYRQYGVLDFELGGTSVSLNIYQNIKLLQMTEYQDYLFLPFKDPTNGVETYAGGRYLEFRMSDLIEKDGSPWLVLDFNKCFNPYCAYSDGYNCPVPPRENHLVLSVLAGERSFKGAKKH